jgi:acyl-coenzyme A synthetase/AMP-(fatty) acid ligase
VRQLYGSTETGTISANLDGPVPDTLESVGRPLDGVTVELLGDDGRPAPPGGAGEIGVRSPWAIGGYAGGVDGEAFRDGLFLTGDLGRTDGDGRLYLLGRRSFFINKGGHKVNPREVEMVLEAHPAVREAVVVGLSTPLGDERVKAVVVLERPTRAEELARFCQERIAAFKVPAIIQFADALPKGPTGKVVRQALGEAPRGARGRPDD